MPTNGELPIQTAPANQPINRRYKPHYHVHQVQESLTSRMGKFLCGTFLTLLLLSGMLVFILWLSLRPHRPRFHTISFSFPALAQDTAGFENAELTFNVTIRNPNQKIGVYYHTMEGAVFYQDQRIGGSSLPLPSAFPYYQESKNMIWIQGQLVAPTTLVITNEMRTELMADRAQGTVWFRLELTSTIQFKVNTWDSRRHKMHASCQVAVGQDGLILPISENKRCPLYFS